MALEDGAIQTCRMLNNHIDPAIIDKLISSIDNILTLPAGREFRQDTATGSKLTGDFEAIKAALSSIKGDVTNTKESTKIYLDNQARINADARAAERQAFLSQYGN